MGGRLGWAARRQDRHVAIKSRPADVTDVTYRHCAMICRIQVVHARIARSMTVGCLDRDFDVTLHPVEEREITP